MSVGTDINLIPAQLLIRKWFKQTNETLWNSGRDNTSFVELEYHR